MFTKNPPKGAAGVRKLGFDLQVLELFLLVCRSGSMTEAAHFSDLTQSAVSRQMKTLEERLGVSLLERGSRPIKPTPAGEQLMKTAEHLIGEAISVRARVLSSQTMVIPQLRLGLIDSLAHPLVPALVRLLKDRVSTVSVSTGFMSPLRERMLKRELDAVISTDPFDDIDGFERYELFSESFIAVIPKGAVPFKNEAEFRTFVNSLPMIRSGQSTSIAKRLDQHFRRLKIDVPHTFSCDTIESVISLVASGIGWTILTPVCIRKSISFVGDIQVVQIPTVGIMRSVYVVFRANEFTNFSEYLAGHCRQILKRDYVPALSAVAPWLGGYIQIVNS